MPTFSEDGLKLLKSIDQKLGILVANAVKQSGSSLKGQILTLSRLGFGSAEIAGMLGITKEHSAKEISMAKKAASKKETI